jgi:hypothetical protein
LQNLREKAGGHFSSGLFFLQYLLVMPFTESGIVTQYYLSEPQSQVINGSIWNLDKEMILELNDSVPEINILISLYEKDNGQLYGFLKQHLCLSLRLS